MRLVLFILGLTFSLSANEPYFETLYDLQSSNFKNLGAENVPRLVLYSGTPGMGKSTLSRKLESTFQAVVISSDEARILFKERGYPRNQLDDYLVYVIDKVLKSTSNGLIILDNTIDSCYTPYFNFLESNKIPLTLVRLIVEREIVESRIITREVDPEPFLKALDGWWDNYVNFGKSRTFDLYFDNTEENTNLEPFLDQFRSLL